MDKSGAALPPRQPPISDADRRHPRFPEYQAYRSAMTRLLVEASSFPDWLRCVQHEAYLDEVSRHPRFKEFQAWMQANKGGARNPHGPFPKNFYAWLEGARW